MTVRNPDGSLTCICHEHRPVCDCAADDPDAPWSEPDNPRLETAISAARTASQSAWDRLLNRVLHLI